jgi:hypothetical protein
LETPKLFTTILSKPEIVDNLIEYYDFEVIEPNSDTEELYFKVDAKATIIAQDASGGIFALIWLKINCTRNFTSSSAVLFRMF